MAPKRSDAPSGAVALLEGGWQRTISAPAPTRRKVLWDNCARLYGLA
jgi:hypothetical protein